MPIIDCLLCALDSVSELCPFRFLFLPEISKCFFFVSGILLTLLCISQSICLMSEPITAIYSFSKIPVVRYNSNYYFFTRIKVFDIYSIRSTCFTFFMIGIFSHCTLTGLMTTISVDLFISVVFPLRLKEE